MFNDLILRLNRTLDSPHPGAPVRTTVLEATVRKTGPLIAGLYKVLDT